MKLLNVKLTFLVEKSLCYWFSQHFSAHTPASSLVKFQRGLVDWLKKQPCDKTVTEFFCKSGKPVIAPCSLRTSQKVKGRSLGGHRVQMCTEVLWLAEKLLILQCRVLVFILLCRSLAVCSLCRYSPLFLLAQQKVLHRSGGTTGYSCHHIGPNLPVWQRMQEKKRKGF